MKNLISCGLILLAGVVSAQNFEGTMKWSLKMEINDPAMKEKLDAANAKMNDPANQVKMREAQEKMQEKMNDPQMQRMMAANPAMKQQMEAAMKMMQGGSVSSMIPQGVTVSIKDNNVLTKIEGGAMPMEILYLKSKEQSYRLDRTNKTYTALKTGTKPAADNKTATLPKVTKTAETMKVLNYTCTKYLVETTQGTHTTNQVIWATTEIQGIDLKALAKQQMQRGQSMMYEGIDGVPLRIEAASPEGTMLMEVTEITPGPLPAAEFTIPADFKEVESPY